MAVRSRRQQYQNTSVVQQEEVAPTNRPKKISSPPPNQRGCRCFWRVLAVLVLFYVSVPFVLRFSTRLQAQLIYFNLIDVPLFLNLSEPTQFELTQTRPFFLQHPNGCRIGAWQVLPGKYDTLDMITYTQFPNKLRDGATIILYLHGNTGNRGRSSRVGIYKYLAKSRGYHVVAFDYRGYGDSDCSASEVGLLEDSHLVWNWIRSNAPNARVYLWGHSLGTSAATSLAEKLTMQGADIAGLVLDAPFTSMLDAAYNHPLAIPYWPVMHYIFKPYVIDNFAEKHASVDRLKNIRCPILIAHGHRDIIIPFHLGKKMYETALATRKSSQETVRFVDCGDSPHKYNYVSTPLRQALDHFIVNQ